MFGNLCLLLTILCMHRRNNDFIFMACTHDNNREFWVGQTITIHTNKTVLFVFVLFNGLYLVLYFNVCYVDTHVSAIKT